MIGAIHVDTKVSCTIWYFVLEITIKLTPKVYAYGISKMHFNKAKRLFHHVGSGDRMAVK